MSTSKMPTSTANWAKTWFEQELVTVSHSEGGSEVKITSVNEVDGDCELGQRENKDGSKAEGKLTIPEVSHEQSDGLIDALYALAKSKLPSLLAERFTAFRTAMLDTHGKDLQVAGTPGASGAATPSISAPTNAASSLSKPVPAKEVSKGITNSAVVTVDASFMASAAELYEFLTDEKRIPAWTRNQAQSDASVGGSYSLFGGGVTGKYIELQKPNKIISTWRLNSPSWPSDHDGKLTITLDQQTDSTKVEFKLSGVPLGQEDETRKNLEASEVSNLLGMSESRLPLFLLPLVPHVRPSPKKPKLHHGLYPAFLLYSPCLPLLVPAIFDLYIPFYNLLLTIAFITFSTRLAASL
ncbi:activator of hsp90 ATPase-like domain-containing protein [Rhizoctonia solani AG-1 IA]|uniref:Activator of hsp90 ATPase-like domain-containing protein n=1 Tax=Thanatephorus cucumeris (strain AG1-IA) TaxID=983506 RepID=L8X6E8_THACA|nr:activator of hsp90 ATPase-like domain-containing protein [Rhizoctonia solani AG-1 IA]